MQKNGEWAEQKGWFCSLLRYRYVFVFLLAFTAYFNTIFNDYSQADELPAISPCCTADGLAGFNIRSFFAPAYHQDNAGYTFGLSPVTLMSFAAEHAVFGSNPHVSHFINVFLYSLLCVILLMVLERLMKNYSSVLILMSVIVFVAHPIHTEVVNGIKNRGQMLSFLFAAFSFLVLFSDIRSFYVRLACSFICFIAALLSDPEIFMLTPLIAFALQVFRKEQVFRILLVSALFSLGAIFLLPDVTGGFKLFYIVGNIFFAVMIIAIDRGWLTVKFIRNKTISADSIFRGAGDGNIAGGITLTGFAYPLWLVCNIVLAVFVFEMANIYSAPVLILPLAVVYVLELYFLPPSQFWPIVLCLDALCLFLLSGNEHLDISDSLLTFLGILNLTLILDFKKMPFLILFLTGTASYLMYKIHIARVTETFTTIAFWTALAYLYRKGLYRSVSVKRILLLLLVASIITVIDARCAKGSDHITDYPLAMLTLMTVAALGAGIYFGGSVRRLIALLGGVQILYIVFITTIYPHSFDPEISNRLNWLFNREQNFIKTIEAFNPGTYLYGADSYSGVHKQVSFAELPVTRTDPLKIKAATSAYQFARYMILIIKPWPMRFYYGYKEINAHYPYEPVALFSMALFALMAACAFVLVKKNNVLSFALFFMVFTLLPYLVIVSPLPGMLADRYAFQASLGFSILFAYMIFYFYNISRPLFFVSARNIRQASLLGFALLISGYAAATFVRNGEWKNAITVMRSDNGLTGRSAQANNLFGIELVKQALASSDTAEKRQLRTEALGHFKKALEIYPGFYDVSADIARVYVTLNQIDSARLYLQKASQIDSTQPDVQQIRQQIETHDH